MTEYDLNEVVKGTKDSIADKFGDMSDQQLAALHDLEKTGQKRGDLLKAIEAEQRKRGKASASTTGSGQASNAGGVAASDGKTPVLFTQQQVDAMLSEQAFKHEQEKDLAVANALQGAKAPEPDPIKTLEPLKIGETAANVSLSALTVGSTIVFVDDTDTPLRELPAMSFVADDFEPTGSSVTLKREVEFPRELAATEIAGAFLLDGSDDPIGKAMLVKPFAIGGGRSAKLGPNTLQFAGS